MKRSIVFFSLFLVAALPMHARARFIIHNTNAAGVGFNDQTPAAPVGGNPGTTIGQQRLNAFQRAADIWGNLIDSPVDIVVDASFADLTCSSTSAVLGQARTTKLVRNFDNAPLQNTWYPIALANKFAGRDLNDGSAAIFAQFSSAIDLPTCLNGIGWYYGYDGKHGNKEDFIVVLLHELAHGLGFASAVNSTTFLYPSNSPGVFDLHIFDNTANLHWDQMTSIQRQASSLNDLKVSFDGPSVNDAARGFLGPTPVLRIDAPSSVAKTYRINTAQFGPKITLAGINGTVVAAQDPSDAGGTSTTDGCSAFTNASSVIGHIALVDRGSCNFTVKVKNAQNAGAIAVIVADNVPDSIPPLGGTDTTITIPTVGVSQADGTLIRGALTSTVSALVFADPSKLAGGDDSNRVLLYMPATFAAGSSISHFDTSANPNLLMEPDISADLPADSVDLTINELIDIGWTRAAFPGRRILKRN